MTLTYETGSVMVKVNHRANYMWQKSFCFKVIIRTHTQSRLHYLDHQVVGKNISSPKMSMANLRHR